MHAVTCLEHHTILIWCEFAIAFVAGAAPVVGGASPMDRLWESYSADIEARNAYEAAGMDIQPIPAIVIKAWVKVNRPTPTATATATAGDEDGLASVLAGAARGSTATGSGMTTTSVHGIDALPFGSVPESQRVKLFLNLCGSKVRTASLHSFAASLSIGVCSRCGDGGVI